MTEGSGPSLPSRLTGPASWAIGLEAVARHEAGHVVVGYLLGLELMDTDVEADPDGGRGHTHFAPAGPWFRPRRRRLSAAERSFIEKILTTFMAGLAADLRAGQADPADSGYDRDSSVRDWAGYLVGPSAQRQALLDQFLARAGAMLEQPAAWRAVEAVTAELLRRRRLTGPEAIGLVVSNLG